MRSGRGAVGESGARYLDDVGRFAEELVEALAPLGDLSWRKMFGGAGLFVDGSMFALVDSSSRLHLKADDANRARFEDTGSARHDRMPYYAVPDDILDDDAALLSWAASSVEVAGVSKD
jgi:DNA transformation protein